jgi:hypothetical protein
MEKFFMGCGFRVQSFVSSSFVFPSVAPAGKYSVWSAEGRKVFCLELVDSEQVGIGQQAYGPAGGQWPTRQMGRGQVPVASGLWPTCSFSVSWHGEIFHKLGIQGAEVSVFPCALPQPSISRPFQQGP